MKMNHFLFCIEFCSFFLLFNASQNYERPFLFNPYTLKIVNWPDSPDATLNGPFATACPLPSIYKEEREFNKNHSMEGKPLFYRDTYSKKEVPRSDINTKCEKSFEMAVAFFRGDTANVVFEFGFEVYAKKIALPENAQVSSYSKYGPVKEARSVWKKFTNKLIHRPNHPYLKQSYIFPTTHYKFIWISKMKTVYDVFSWSPISMQYKMFRNSIQQLDVGCQDYDLGKKFYKRKFGFIDEFYSVKTQRNLFELVKLPDLPEGSVCKKTSKCVKKYDLLPPYNFQTHSSSSVSCSNLTTVPIWYEVNEDLLINLKKFLVAMSQVTEQKLTIVPGTYGVISFPKIYREYKVMKMYLNLEDEKIPIPKIIYNIVRYQSYNCDPQIELCWFNVVIVIHNQPKIPNSDRLCPQDICEPWGWDDIQYTRPYETRVKSKHIYCCRLDADLRSKLKFSLGSKYNGDLNLKYFPYHDEKNIESEEAIDKNNYVDKQEEFKNQLKKLRTEILLASE